MFKIFKKNKQKIRFLIFLLLTFVSYFFSIFYLFGAHDILASIVCVFFLYVFFHFLSLDFGYFKKKYIFLFIVLLIFFDLLLFFLFSWNINLWLIISVFVFNISLLLLFYFLDTVDFTSISYFLRGGYIFTLFITITYSFALIGMFTQFPFTCEGLRDASDKLVRFVENPFLMPTKKITNNISGYQENYQKELVDEKVEDIVIGFKGVDLFADSGSVFYPIVSKINVWKQNTIDQIVSDQESYSQDMCNMLLAEINEKYKLREFGLSAVALTYLLLFGFVRLSFFIMSFIGFLMFKLLYLFGLYKIKKVKREVKKIK